MRSTHGIVSILLALILAGSNMVFSGHVSSHAPTDSGLCSQCIHPGGSGSAIAPEPKTIYFIPVANSLSQVHAITPILPVILHDHQSRAPPSVT